jgi:hypothetical protein
MSEETFAVSLAGRRWDLPHLPFRAIKKIQPVLFQIYAELGGAAISTSRIAELSEVQLDRLADATWQAIVHVDPGLARDAFLDLPFSVGELMLAFPSLANAAGLRAVKPSEAPPTDPPQEAPGESISTD